MITKKANISKVLKNLYFDKKEPLSLVHFVTNRCNARCSFCFIDFDNPKTFHGELSLEEINELTKNLGNSLLNVNLTGGEPFARKDLIDIAKCYLKNSTVQSIYVTTNASLPDRIEKFAKEISLFSPVFPISEKIQTHSGPNGVRRVEIWDGFVHCAPPALSHPGISPVLQDRTFHTREGIGYSGGFGSPMNLHFSTNFPTNFPTNFRLPNFPVGKSSPHKRNQ